MSNNEICAPGIKNNDNTCYSYKQLKKIASEYNKKNNNKIDIKLSKKDLLNELTQKFSTECNNQKCWLKILETNLQKIFKKIFRPCGPNKKFEWLNTKHINNVLEQYQSIHKNFLFLGAVPYDFYDLKILQFHNFNFHEFENKKIYKLGLVINLDNHNMPGSHWVALYVDLQKNQIYFFDSVGKKPGTKICKFINKIIKYLYFKKFKKDFKINDFIYLYFKSAHLLNDNIYYKNIINGNFDIRYNHIQHQFKNSECGVYSINFIVRLLENETFDSIINNITKDDEMNNYRKEIFYKCTN